MNDLRRLVAMAELLVAKQSEYLAAEKALGEMKVDLLRLEREDIPTLMAELGVTDITLNNGKKLFLKEDVDARITEANKAEAFRWLINNGFGGLIKTMVAVQFGRGEHDEASRAAQTLREEFADRQVMLDESVHYQTLKAFVRERMEKGEALPADLFGVYPFTKAVVKD